MSEFKRENRYIVIKRSDLENVPVGYLSSLIEPIGALQAHLPYRECLVIESDWPEYEKVWRSIELRMTGQPTEDFDRVTAERDAMRTKLAELESELEEFAIEMTLAISDSQIRSAMTVIGRSRFLQLLQAYNSRIDAALKPAEGGGDETI